MQDVTLQFHGRPVLSAHLHWPRPRQPPFMSPTRLLCPAVTAAQAQPPAQRASTVTRQQAARLVRVVLAVACGSGKTIVRTATSCCPPAASVSRNGHAVWSKTDLAVQPVHEPTPTCSPGSILRLSQGQRQCSQKLLCQICRRQYVLHMGTPLTILTNQGVSHEDGASVQGLLDFCGCSLIRPS